MRKVEFIHEFRTKARQLAGFRLTGDWVRLAEALEADGITLTGDQAARWANTGHLPGEAAPLIRAGVTPEIADEMDQLAIDIAGGPEAHAMDVIDRLAADGALVNPSRVRWREDPDDPTHIIVDITPRVTRSPKPPPTPALEAPMAHDYQYIAAQVLRHGEQWYTDLLGRIRQDQALVTAMWQDAEGHPDELDVPDTYWSVTILDDGTPAAWAAATVLDDGTIKSHSNYEVREHRGRGLYTMAYHARHTNVFLAYQLPAVTYLYPQPVDLHLADGWVKDTAPDASGTSVSYAGGPVHHWQRLTWTPRTCR
jgi:hypothetical protein